jgi:hypothetical protein
MIKRSIEVEISRNNETQKYAKDWDAFFHKRTASLEARHH